MKSQNESSCEANQQKITSDPVVNKEPSKETQVIGDTKQLPSAPKRRKKSKDAPKLPINAFVRYMNVNREKYKQQNPNLLLHDITKLLAADWAKMLPADKQSFVDEAEKDQERYNKEMQQYQKIETLKYPKNSNVNDQFTKKEPFGVATGFQENNPEKKIAKMNFSCDIPIFTQEFLEHNKAMESELRQLRRQQADVEEDNAVLSGKVHNLRHQLSSLQNDVEQQRKNNESLQQHLEMLRSRVVEGLNGITMPGSGEAINCHNLQKFLTHVCDLNKKISNNENEQNNERDVTSDTKKSSEGGGNDGKDDSNPDAKSCTDDLNLDLVTKVKEVIASLNTVK